MVPAGDGKVLGRVAVDVTRVAVARGLDRQVPALLLAALAALLLAAAGTALISRRLRRQTHGLGPDELARMYVFHDAVLHAVREGLLLLDLRGRLLLAGDEACRLLELPAGWAGRRLAELGLPTPMTAALKAAMRCMTPYTSPRTGWWWSPRRRSVGPGASSARR
jgi:sensor histidine kinase regulating citrate/malate metabolism